MPTDTFLKLPEEKKEKILLAAKHEFSRVPFERTSIKNIVEEAEIARGSFYQYFESKEDLLNYILYLHIGGMDQKLEKQLQKDNYDIFELFLFIYDYITKECMDKKNVPFFKKIFENIKTSEDTIFFKKIREIRTKNINHYFEKIDKTKLRIQDQEDFEIILKILYAVTGKAIVNHFRYNSKESARKIFEKELEFLKYGILKKESEEKTC